MLCLQSTLELLGKWLGERFRAEVASVKALWNYIAESIEKEQQLHYRLELLSEDCIVDEVAFCSCVCPDEISLMELCVGRSDVFTPRAGKATDTCCACSK